MRNSCNGALQPLDQGRAAAQTDALTPEAALASSTVARKSIFRVRTSKAAGPDAGPFSRCTSYM